MAKHEFASRRDKIAWYLDEIDSYKEDMGRWYTVLIRRILPFLIFIVPIIVISDKIVGYVIDRYLYALFGNSFGTLAIVAWMIALLIFLAILIFLPRFATFCEFVITGGFYYLCVKTLIDFNNGLASKPLISSAFGYTILIALSIFMFMKLVFFVIEVIYRITFHGEKEPKAYKDDSEDLVL